MLLWHVWGWAAFFFFSFSFFFRWVRDTGSKHLIQVKSCLVALQRAELKFHQLLLSTGSICCCLILNVFWSIWSPAFELLFCIPTDFFYDTLLNSVHWAGSRQVLPVIGGLFVGFFNCSEPRNSCSSRNLIKAGMIQACLLKCNQAERLFCFNLIFHGYIMDISLLQCIWRN